MTPEDWARTIREEWSLADVILNIQLDTLCRTVGLDPETTWRTPRAVEGRPTIYHAALGRNFDLPDRGDDNHNGTSARMSQANT